MSLRIFNSWHGECKRTWRDVLVRGDLVKPRFRFFCCCQAIRQVHENAPLPRGVLGKCDYFILEKEMPRACVRLRKECATRGCETESYVTTEGISNRMAPTERGPQLDWRNGDASSRTCQIPSMTTVSKT